MRILVVGAGAVVGYFGGRLLQAGRDVTFLVRPARAARLAQTGLAIESRFGNAILASPPTLLATEIHQPFDIVLLSCKAFDLEDAINAFAPAVGPNTVILPLLNGMRHLDILEARFGSDRVLGGQCQISTKLDATGNIIHLSDVHLLTFGERGGGVSPRVNAIATVMAGALFESRASDAILQEMWEKWAFLAALAGITCLTRAAVGDIVAAGGADLATALFDECRSIAAAAGYAPRPAFVDIALGRLTAPGSPITASMLGDVERGGRSEADHILGDLLRRRGDIGGTDRSLLRIAYTSLKAWDARMARERKTST